MILVLFGEKDKANKIKANKKNLINYLGVEDLWNKKIYKDTNFNRDLNELKKFNIQINKIIWLYDYLIEKEEEEDYIKEIEDYIEKKNTKKEPTKPKTPSNTSSDNDDINSDNSESVNSDEEKDENNDEDEEGD